MRDRCYNRNMRLDRHLSASGLGTRTQVRDLIRAGRVRVAGVVVRDPGPRLPDRDLPLVEIDGAEVSLRRHIHLMLHKPAGCVTAMEDPRHPTVADLLPTEIRGRVAPVGRLDIDVTGLLLLTGAGVLAHRLASPKWEVDKTYRVTYDGPDMTDADVEVFSSGLTLADGTLCRPARRVPCGPGLAMLTIHEGRFHQVKNMIRAAGRSGTALVRERMGPLTLDESLAPGAYRLLTEKETAALYATVSLNH